LGNGLISGWIISIVGSFRKSIHLLKVVCAEDVVAVHDGEELEARIAKVVDISGRFENFPLTCDGTWCTGSGSYDR
jgi:hypothetical protein